nr:ribonuclease H-like domain-containing protein [Tanacetum cinerariifolium]
MQMGRYGCLPNPVSRHRSPGPIHTRASISSLRDYESCFIPGQETILRHAFNVVTLQDPATGALNMDTGASSYLNDSVTSLSDVFNTCIYPSISVGNGHTIPVTNTANSS